MSLNLGVRKSKCLTVIVTRVFMAVCFVNFVSVLIESDFRVKSVNSRRFTTRCQGRADKKGTSQRVLDTSSKIHTSMTVVAKSDKK